MGHYDSCYEEEWEEEQRSKVKRVKELTEKYERQIHQYGIAKFLAMKEVFK